MIRITVITPSRNSERFLERTLRSVAAQRSPELSVEHIIMDGGSTDDTEALVWQSAHPDTHFVSSKDSGPADAINKGLALATGEYLCWLNSDDFYAPDALERAVAALERAPRKAFCFGHCPIVDADGKEIRPFVTRFKEFWYPLSCRFVFRTLNYISQPATVFRKSAFEAAGPLRTDLKAAWDYEFFLRLWRHGGGVRMKRPPLAFFRWTPDSISGRNFALQFRESAECAARDAGRFAPSALLHRVCSFLIVLCYRRMSGRRGEY